jgi:hypothetical protein
MARGRVAPPRRVLVTSTLDGGMATIPLTITCECGEAHRTELGQVVSCTCGRRYDTTELDQSRLIGVRHSQLKMRVYITCGTLLIGGGAAAMYFVWGLRGVAIGVPIIGLLWFRVIAPVVRKRVFYGAGELPTWKLEANEVEPER